MWHKKAYNDQVIASKKTPTIVFLSTYPPRECGIATFTQDLLTNCQTVLGTSAVCKVAAFNLTPHDTYKYPKEVAWQIDQNSKEEHHQLAADINDDDTVQGVIVQHEYGIFGGPEGSYLLQFMKRCRKPMLVTLHTALPAPTPAMKRVTKQIIRLANQLVVLTNRSKEIIEELYPESIGKISVIPHGIHATPFNAPKAYKKKVELANRTLLTTFGLLSPGKGIEYVLEALPDVIQQHPSVLYLVLGETHPVIRRRQGERYRLELLKRVTQLGLKKHVKFYNQYMSLTDLLEFLKATDIYISTSTDPNQAVSGTLSYALGTGRAVVSTEFAQAKEIITPNVGRLVPIKNSRALTTALLDLLSDTARLTTMARTAYTKTRPMLWSRVAEQYILILQREALPPLKLTHLVRMTDEFGLFQFAKLTEPDTAFGYTVDDNARALILCCWLSRHKRTRELEKLIGTYLRYLTTCLQPDGRFINYINHHDKQPSEQNTAENLEEAQSRALWALSEVLRSKHLSPATRKHAKRLFLRVMADGPKPTFLRSQAFSLKALAIAQQALPDQRAELRQVMRISADALVQAFHKHSSTSWQWFENGLHYNNGILPESLLLTGQVLKQNEYSETGVRALEFLMSKTFSAGMYRPIGHSHWYKKWQKRSHYDQQPEDPASMILALTTAFTVTQENKYRNYARLCFTWFLGNNTRKISLYDNESGGCYDGLHPDRANLNQGAESLVSYLMARYLIEELR